ncbi:hypothetical protein BDR03DRAFT_987225 [Suillus americanus]|nr:hypothetical protein BDR03DRAFT_987225 [Suillus americanus]
MPLPDMTLVSNDPAWLPFINVSISLNYIVVVSFSAVVYDWVQTGLGALHWNTVFSDQHNRLSPILDNRCDDDSGVSNGEEAVDVSVTQFDQLIFKRILVTTCPVDSLGLKLLGISFR